MADPDLSLEALARDIERAHPAVGGLDRLQAALEMSERLETLGDELVGHFAEQARRSGATWAQIGSVLGVSKQAVHQRFVGAPAVGAAQPPRFTMPGDYSERARTVLDRASQASRSFRHDYLGTEHLLVAMAGTPSVAGQALAALGVTETVLRRHIEDIIGRSDPVLSPTGPGTVCPKFKRSLELARKEAKRSRSRCVRTEHMLVGLLRLGDSMANTILSDLGVTEAAARAELETILARARPEAEAYGR